MEKQWKAKKKLRERVDQLQRYNDYLRELDEIELDDLDLTDFEGGILDDFGTDEEIQMDEELELVLG